MRPWLLRYRHTLLHGSLIMIPLLLLYIHGRQENHETKISRTFAWVAAPGQATMSTLVSATSDFVKGYILLVNVEKKNRALREENFDLKQRVNNIVMRLTTAERRARACGFRYAREDLDLLPARIISHSLGHLNQVLRIQVQQPLGSAGKISVDTSVITPNGLVGRVARVQGRYLDVQVITDPQARVHARAGSKGILGSVIGRGPEPNHRLRFVTTEGKARLKAGDTVVSSGQDHRYIPGLIVGVIADGNARQSGVELEYLMDPVVPFWEIREVFLVRGKSQRDDSACYQECVNSCDQELEEIEP